MSVSDPAIWSALAEQPVMGSGATVFAYLAAVRLAKRYGYPPLLNPTFVAIIGVAVGIRLIGVPYSTYLHGASFIHFLLGPAVVLLAVPLYRQTALIRTSESMIAVALAVGLPTGIFTAVGVAWLFGAGTKTILSIAPKSVTTGIAIGISERIGGVPALTTILVIMTGITGAIAGPWVTRVARIRDPRAIGLAMGIASHGIGTARALQINEVAGAFAGLGMGLNGILTAILIPVIYPLL